MSRIQRIHPEHITAAVEQYMKSLKMIRDDEVILKVKTDPKNPVVVVGKDDNA